MKIIIIFFLSLFYVAISQAQFKCLPGAICEDSNDYVCSASQRLWRQIKSQEDIWSTLLNVHFIDENTVRYSSEINFCRHTGSSGKNISQVYVLIEKDTKTTKKYKVIHSACDKNKAIVESMEIRGQNFEPLNRKNIIFDLNRKFDLSSNEKYKDYYVTSENKTFVSSDPEVKFNAFKAELIFRTSAQKYTTINDIGVESERVLSHFWLFDKEVFTQDIDKTKKTSQYDFKSPKYSFNYRIVANKSNSICYQQLVEVSFLDFLQIKPSNNSTTYGLVFNQFVSDCIGQEVTAYIESAAKTLKHHVSQMYPKFSRGGVVNQNEQLQKDIEDLIRYIRAGNSELSLSITEKFLQDVRSNSILDNR